jgi:hypothetical protein
MTAKKQAVKAEPISAAVLFRLAEAMNMNRVEIPIPGGLKIHYACRLCKGRSMGVADEIAHMESCPLGRLKQ